MRAIRTLLFLALALPAAAQTEGKIIRLDGAMERIAPASARIEKLASGFGFSEGPVWVSRGGYLLFSDIPNNAIHKWTPGGGTTVFRKPSGYDGSDAPRGALVGSNGLTIDREGRLLICEHGNRRLTRLEKDGKITVLADRFEGKRLNSPNDVVVKSDGSIYFTDPPYGLVKEDANPQKELAFNGIYRLAGGRLELLYRDLTRPNGLAFSPDEKRLYVANSDPKRKLWMRFEVTPEGKLANGKVFYDVTSDNSDGLPDGLRVDENGNLYGTGPGGIWVISPEGKHIGSIIAPEVPANAAFGDADGKTLYMTARKGLYRVRLSVAGLRPR